MIHAAATADRAIRIDARRLREAPAVPAPGFSALEWSVIALAERDGIRSLASPGRIATAVAALFGTGGNPRLADPRLEALRRLAVFAWSRGYALPKAEIAAFHDAGFTAAQLQLLVTSIDRRTTDRIKGRLA